MRAAMKRCGARVSRTLHTTGLTRQLALQSDWLLDLKDVRRPTGTTIRSRPLHTSRLLRQQSATVDASAADPRSAPPRLITRFEELETTGIIHRNVVQTLTRDMKLETMTEVQSATINQALRGNDIIAQAKTGTGKTLAFLIPILQNIIGLDPSLADRQYGRRPATSSGDIRAIIISPTRELAEQIATEARRLVANTGVIVQAAVGGTHKSLGLRLIQSQGCHILVATPGRLSDILSDRYNGIEAPNCSAFVLDEADRLLDQGFYPEIQNIMSMLPSPAQVDRQTMMFSATVPMEVVDLVKQTLKPGFDFVKCVNDNDQPTQERVQQNVVIVDGFLHQALALVELCTREIAKAKQPGARPFKAIIYFNSTAEVTAHASAFQNLTLSRKDVAPAGSNISAAFGLRREAHMWPDTSINEIHSRLTQERRTASSQMFRRAQSGILLSSDVTARGMDFPDVTHVIQVGLSQSRDQYIHRVGRTARAGKEGEGWLIINSLEEHDARKRLRGLPLQRDTSLETTSTDPSSVSPDVKPLVQQTLAAYSRVGYAEKAKVYMALLGVFGWVTAKEDLVELMNQMATGLWGLSEPPKIPPGLAGRLGLSRIPGLNVGFDDGGDFGRPRQGSSGVGRFGSSFGRPSLAASSFGGSRAGRDGSFADFRGSNRGSDARGGGRRSSW